MNNTQILIYTSDVGLAFSLSKAIQIENFLSIQMAIASSINKCLMFSHLCKHNFEDAYPSTFLDVYASSEQK
jgi:hypothetical protein